MEDKELEKLNKQKEDIERLIERMFNTVSINQETQATEDLMAITKKIDKKVLIEMAGNFGTFGKCVLYYKTPIELRLDVDFINATKVSLDERLRFWKEYKVKLHDRNLNSEEEYNKIIMMACILHVPINDDESEKKD